ncbi:MAG: YwaF family protein [Oscillospiraceae bacterium]|jgi:hypothetical protein|nr:YwaF family protein [Oscillospiraceae bacterium]
MPVQFWSGDGGVPGDFSYGTVHILAVVFLVLLSAALSVFGAKKMSETGRRKTVVTLAVLALGFEVFWRIVFLARGKEAIELYPFYPCNLAGLLVPVIALSNNKILKEMFYLFAFIGGVVTFAIPDGIFTNQYLTFPILKSILQHCAIIILPVFEYCNKTYTPKFKNFWLAICGMLVHLFNSEIMPKLFGQTGTDYIFLRSGLPFVIPGVPGWLTLTVFAIIIVIISYAVLDFKGFKALFKKS